MYPYLIGVLILLFIVVVAFVIFRRRIFALCYDRAVAKYEAWIATRKKRLLGSLEGSVLEIGPGTGANFIYLPKSISWAGVEPSPHMQRKLSNRAKNLGIQTEFRDIGPDGMQVAGESVDCVLSTLVLCSVEEPRAALQDIRRVLKPGGKFVFIEHVAAEKGSSLWRRQRRIRPLWRFINDGCCPDRELGDLIREAGFSSVAIEAFTVPKEVAPAIVSPHISGFATR